MKYRTIVADPPWDGPYRTTGFTWRAGLPSGSKLPMDYTLMSTANIAALPVRDFAEDSAHLYLWTTNHHLRASYDIAEAWGFSPVKPVVWCKAPVGPFMGGPFGGSSVEFCLFAKRGQLSHKERAGRQWFEWPRSEHSAKPDAFLDIVEQVSPGPYLEMFARRARFGWDYWGDESLGTAEMPA